MHIGSRTASSSFGTLKSFTLLQIAQTFGWYIFSAWWFTVVYVWSSSNDSNLELVKRGRPHERPTLNERPIYLHSFHAFLACVQAVFHLYNDYDRIAVPIAEKCTKKNDQRTHPVLPTSKYLRGALLPELAAGAFRSITVAGASLVIYPMFFRSFAWSWSLYFAKLFWSFPRSAAEPQSFIPSIFPYFFFKTLIPGAMLVLSWQTANLFYSVFIGKEPSKRGQPLTTEAKDPNGSLLSGLKARKEIVKTFALWELSLISQRVPDRRKAIFNDIEREGGSAWSQVLACTTDVIKAINTRIEESKNPAPVTNSLPQTKKSEPVLQILPRLSEPIKDENIFTTAPKAASRQDKFGDAFSSAAKSFGQSEDWTPTARARVRDAFDRASSAMLSPEQKQKYLGSTQKFKLLAGGPYASHTPKDMNPILARILRSPIGQPLCQTYAQRLSSIVLGTPESSLSLIVDAVESLTRLLIASLAEDPYGKVQADVPSVVRLLTRTVLTLDAFAHQGGLDAHWTDINFPPSSDPQAQAVARRIPDVEIVLSALRDGLKDLLAAFRPYLRDIGIAGKDLRLAKEAAGIDGEEVS
ncbi:Nuclear envelope protein, putative [Penicillium digitatum PHI26]|uniref:Nuclear envelope protein, putative n=3 Tax=Penicillium digitatum TaxID=36651 RepID=K9GYI7_PEND2|nr:Nuclear envelope protein, putative [Penicillium digitatum Pd1]EKV19713.1 Nuclear envelope protein, putative [Penicillium digitatum PHI26]EKV20825.1 Nuclear envelope protein, putative [Penicillium digitatum Pd1]